MASLAGRICDIARSQIGVRERGQNRGAQIAAYQKAVGVPPGSAWCAAFVFWVVVRACEELQVPCMLPRTGSVHRMWQRAETRLRSTEPAPGMIYLRDSGGGLGHCGIVERVDDGLLHTIEGNTDGKGGRDGDGVHRRVRRRSYVTLGYLDVTRAVRTPRTPEVA